MRHYLQDARHAGVAALGAVGTQLLYGRSRPTWDPRQEVIVRSLRAAFHGALDRPLPQIRQQFNQIVLFERVRRRARRRWVRLGGVPAMWTFARKRGTVVFYLHGGAYVFGSPRSHAILTADLAAASGADVLALDYRLAPEHPFPAQLEDALAAWRALLARGVSPESVVFAGDSAGGALVLSTMWAAMEQGLPLPSAAVCISPWVDLTMSFDSHKTNGPYDYIGELPLMASFADAVARDVGTHHRWLSPSLHELPRLPPLLIQVGGAEILHDEALELTARAKAAGGTVKLEVWPDQVHVWHAFSHVVPDARQAIRHAGAWIRQYARPRP